MENETLHRLFMLAYAQGKIDFDKRLSNEELAALEESIINFVKQTSNNKN